MSGGRGDGPMVKKPAYDGLVEGLSVEGGRAKLGMRVLGPARARPGQGIGYRVVIRNVGSRRAVGVRLTTNLPGRLLPPSMARMSNRTFTQRGGTISWSLGEIPAGAQSIVTLRPRVAPDGRARLASWFELRSHSAASLNRRHLTVITA